jgi:spermidine synthase
MPPETDERRAGLAPLSALFFFSGVSGLVYQVVWFRMLARAFGVTVYAVTTVLVVYMGGLAIGSLVASRFGRKGALLRTYGVLEVLVGLTAALASEAMLWLPSVLRHVSVALGHGGPATTVLRIVVACLLLMPPTVLMGATLPILSGYVTLRNDALGSHAGLLYGANTLGAVVGVLGAGFVLIAALGEKRTVFVAVVLNVAVGVLSLALARRAAPSVPAERQAGSLAEPSRAILLATFASGVAALSFEVIWFRVLTVLVGNSVYGFACMLGTYLAGVGVGSVVMARWADRLRRPWTMLGGLEIAVGLLAVLSLTAFQTLGLRTFDPRYTYGLLWGSGDFATLAVSSVVTVLPATLLYGAIFPVATRLVALSTHGSDARRPEVAIGRLYASNTLGNIVGSMLTGFVLIPTLGTRFTFLGMAVLSVLIGVTLLSLGAKAEWPQTSRGAKLVVAALLVSGSLGIVGMVATGEDPFVRVLKQRAGPIAGELVANEEDRGATISLFEDQTKNRTLYINGLYVSNTGPGLGEQMVNLPLAFEPAPGPKRVLAVGLGVGQVLRYAVDAGHDITIAELQSSVVDLFRRFNPDHAKYLESPHATIALADGRNYLESTDAKYDVILVDGSPPVYAAGMVNLYSLELAKLAKEHLSPGGIFVVWFPVVCFESDFWMLVHNFAETFPEIAVYSPPSSSNAMLMGTVGPEGVFAIDVEVMAERLARYLEHPPLTAPHFLEGMFLSGSELRKRAAGYPVVTDDRPYTEFPLARFLAGDAYHADNRFLYPERFPRGTHRCAVGDLGDCTAQCDAGQVDSCFVLGIAYMGSRGNDTAALAALDRACAGGIGDACYDLGFLAQHGRGGPADAAKAAVLFRRACDEGVLGACNDLGVAYETGRGVARDSQAALTLLRHACRGGLAAGCFDLGAVYEAGAGGDRSPVEAAAAYKAACDRAYAPACARLSKL